MASNGVLSCGGWAGTPFTTKKPTPGPVPSFPPGLGLNWNKVGEVTSSYDVMKRRDGEEGEGDVAGLMDVLDE
jgi:hypothetical protein